MDIFARRLEDDDDTPEEDRRAQRVMVVRVAGDDEAVQRKRRIRAGAAWGGLSGRVYPALTFVLVPQFPF